MLINRTSILVFVALFWWRSIFWDKFWAKPVLPSWKSLGTLGWLNFSDLFCFKFLQLLEISVKMGFKAFWGWKLCLSTPVEASFVHKLRTTLGKISKRGILRLWCASYLQNAPKLIQKPNKWRRHPPEFPKFNRPI